MLSEIGIILGGAAVAIWMYLIGARHRFWRADQRLEAALAPHQPGPSVVAVVPARNEAEFVGAAISSLLQQSYAPALRAVLVDDESDDGTGRVARDAARRCGAADRLLVLDSAPRPPGWTGKMWALAQGVAAAERLGPRYLLLTDADIVHDRDSVRQLVAKAERDGRDLVSLMVRLHCEGAIERLLIPAFVFFFQKLYPFPAVNDPDSRVAAAAGGCMLVRADALVRAGGIAAVRDQLIDDCALARRIKAGGPIWLGLADRTASLRPYRGLRDIWHMVARTAYTQLRHSPWLLAGAVLGMMLTYLAAPTALLIGVARDTWAAAALGAAAWLLMCVAYAPTLRLYRVPSLWAAALPLAALLYTLMTIDSARRHWQGRDGEWKGRLRGGVAAGPVGRSP